MDSPINNLSPTGIGWTRKAPMADASTTTKPAGQGQPAGAYQDRTVRSEGAGAGSPGKVSQPSHSQEVAK